jgi:hypothetical protein
MQSDLYSQQGRDHYKRGEYKKAIECFGRAISRAGAGVSAQLLDHRAACHARLEDYPSALKDAKKAINVAREDPTGYLRAGKVLVGMERKSVALEIYAHGLKSVRHVGQGYEALRKAHGALLSELAPERSIDPFTLLPREIAFNILEYLDFRQRVAIMRTSKQWRAFIRSEPRLWTHLDFSKARRKVRAAFVSTAINTAGRKIRAATITSKNYDIQKVLGAIARQTTLEKLTLPDIGIFDRGLVEALNPAKSLVHIVVGHEVETTESVLNSFFARFTPQLKHVELDLTGHMLERGQSVPTIPRMQFSNLLTLHIKTRCWPYDELQHALSEAASLQSLNICVRDVRVTPGTNIDLRHCEHLRQLCLHLDGLAFDRILFPPSIEILKLGAKTSPRGFTRDGDTIHPLPLDLPRLRELELDMPYLSISATLAMLDQRRTGPAQSDARPRIPLRKLVIHHPIGIDRPGILQDSVWDAFERDMFDHALLADLEHLAVLGTDFMNDGDLVPLVKRAPALHTLDTGQCRINGVTVKAIVELGYLRELRVGPSSDLPRDALEWARKQGIHVHVTPYREPPINPDPRNPRPRFPF